HFDLPLAVAGGDPAWHQGGRHVKFDPKAWTPMTNLLLTLLDRVGVHKESIGDSTGRLDLGPRSVSRSIGRRSGTQRLGDKYRPSRAPSGSAPIGAFACPPAVIDLPPARRRSGVHCRIALPMVCPRR